MPTSGSGPTSPAKLLAAAESSTAAFLADLERVVGIDSGSGDLDGIEAVADVIEARLAGLGAAIERHRDERWGSTVVGTFDRGEPGPSVVIVGHMDTVFDRGAAAARPLRIEGSRALGPGVCDMKGGLILGLQALEVLRATRQADADAVDRDVQGWLPVARLAFIANPDEEVGSFSSADIIADHARRSDAALVLEAARSNGDVVSARKGQMDVHVHLTGRAAHSGVAPEAGRSAVVEAAHQILAIAALDGSEPGLTINAGVVRGGTRANVVAERASIVIDVRARERDHLEAAESAIRAIAAKPTTPDILGTVEISARQWPMPRTAAGMRLVEHAVGVAADLGFELGDSATGGGSDANLIADLGIPTIDGLGPVGGDDHTDDEYIELDSVGWRIALLAGLLERIGGESWAPRASG